MCASIGRWHEQADLLASRMSPLTDPRKIPSGVSRAALDGVHAGMKGIAICMSDNAARMANFGAVADEERGEHSISLCCPQACRQRHKRHVRKDRLSDGKIKSRPPTAAEARGRAKGSGTSNGRQFFFGGRQECGRNVQPVVVAGVEVRRDLDRSASRSAADVQQPMLWPQALGAQELQLQFADLVPQSADNGPVGAGINRVAHLPFVFVAGVHVGLW